MTGRNIAKSVNTLWEGYFIAIFRGGATLVRIILIFFLSSCHFLNILFEVYYSRIYKGIIQNVESIRKRQKTS